MISCWYIKSMVQSMISVGHWKVQDQHIQTYWYHHFLDVDCGIYILSLLLLSRIPTGVRVSNQFLKIGRTMCGSSPWMNTSVSHRLMLRGPRGMEAISRSVCGDAKSVGKPLVLQRMIKWNTTWLMDLIVGSWLLIIKIFAHAAETMGLKY